jgi:hypothetical protein
MTSCQSESVKHYRLPKKNQTNEGDNKEESNEPDYDEDQGQLEEEQDEEEVGEITTNQIF